MFKRFRFVVTAVFVVLFLLLLSITAQDKKTSKKAKMVEYESVKIGNQIWMKKNLDVDHYRNGDPIPEVKKSYEWEKLTTGAWCYNENDTKNGKVYGKLYNWYAVNDPRGLAPEGWHIPTDDEWTELVEYVGGEEVAGGRLKEKGTKHWESPNKGAINESGFSALPGGSRDYSGAFRLVGNYGDWWVATESGATDAWHRYMNDENPYAYSDALTKEYGFSVRCIKD